MAPCSHVVLTTGEIMNGQQLSLWLHAHL